LLACVCFWCRWGCRMKPLSAGVCAWVVVIIMCGAVAITILAGATHPQQPPARRPPNRRVVVGRGCPGTPTHTTTLVVRIESGGETNQGGTPRPPGNSCCCSAAAPCCCCPPWPPAKQAAVGDGRSIDSLDRWTDRSRFFSVKRRRRHPIQSSPSSASPLTRAALLRARSNPCISHAPQQGQANADHHQATKNRRKGFGFSGARARAREREATYCCSEPAAPCRRVERRRERQEQAVVSGCCSLCVEPDKQAAREPISDSFSMHRSPCVCVWGGVLFLLLGFWGAAAVDSSRSIESFHFTHTRTHTRTHMPDDNRHRRGASRLALRFFLGPTPPRLATL
jgi:hypothetical protein